MSYLIWLDYCYKNRARFLLIDRNEKTQFPSRLSACMHLRSRDAFERERKRAREGRDKGWVVVEEGWRRDSKKETIEAWKSFRWNREYPRNLQLENGRARGCTGFDVGRKRFHFRWMATTVVAALFEEGGGGRRRRRRRIRRCRALIARELIKL